MQVVLLTACVVFLFFLSFPYTQMLRRGVVLRAPSAAVRAANLGRQRSPHTHPHLPVPTAATTSRAPPPPPQMLCDVFSALGAAVGLNLALSLTLALTLVLNPDPNSASDVRGRI